MKSFHLFHENKDIELFIEAIDIENFQPKDGEWSHSSYGSTYKFNIEGDDCSDCPGYKSRNNEKCYSVSFSSSAGDVSIGFSRCGSYSDANKNVQWALSKSILKAVIEYIDQKQPKSFSWSPVYKTKENPVQGRIVNADARKKLYSKFFARYLFPDKYVPISDAYWVSTKEYLSKYVSDGYAPIPENLTKDSTASEKSAAAEQMIAKTKENRENIERAEAARRQEEYRRQREEEERRRREQEEMLQRSIEDLRYNPNQVKQDDIVVIIRPPEGEANFRYRDEYAYKIAKLERFYLTEDVLYARVRFASEDSDSMEFTGSTIEVPAKNLKKEDETSKRERENRIAEKLNSLLSNPEYNPNGIKEGDEVISYVSPNSRDNNFVGVVKKITYSKSYYGTEYTLLAKIEWNEESINRLNSIYRDPSSPARIKNLFKNTEENRNEIRRKIRSHEVESQASRNRDRIQRRRQRDEYVASRTSNQSPEEIQSLVNHPNNPQNLKINDFVKINPIGWYNRRYRNKKGTIVSLRKDPYDETRIKIGVAIHRTHRVAEFYANELERDTSENAARIQTRQRRRQEVSQLSRGFNIGDNVRVTRGRYNGKTGTILNFRLVNGILSAIIASEERNFSVKIDFIERLQSPLPEMNLTFKNYISIIESF